MAQKDTYRVTSRADTRRKNKQRSMFRITISWLLTLAISGLVAASAGAVLLVATYANVRNTTELLNISAEILVETIKANVFELTTPIETLARALQQDTNSGAVDLTDTAFLQAYFKGVSASVPYLTDLAIVYPDGRLFNTTHTKGPDGSTFHATTIPANAGLIEYVNEVQGYADLVWNEPFYDQGRTHISVAIPARKDGVFQGAILVSSTVQHFTEIVDDLSKTYGATGFILYGDTDVLAHPKLLDLPKDDLNSNAPLHSITALDDPVITQMLKQVPEFQGDNGSFDGFVVRVAGAEQLVLASSVETFGAQPWVIGQYAPLSDWSSQWTRLSDAAWVGLGLMVVSVLAALLLAQRLAAPIRRATQGAREISDLKLAQVDYLPPSHVAELNLQADAFNRMLDGLRWFETYLPRTLVRQLLKTRDPNLVAPREVESTVMFADIQGFTAASEASSPQETADLLNRHFEILNRCIEAEGGTIDKYIGDAVMAFWGAPQEQMDHAERASRAALAIRNALATAGVDYRVKIALHTGPLIVGNIGAVDRMNYTVIGDTVNTCARIENLAGSLESDEQTRILVSDETKRRLGPSFNVEHAGKFPVRGRQEKVSVYNIHAVETMDLPSS